MSNVCNFLDYFNPFSPEFHQATDNFKYKLEGWQKGVAIVAAIAAGIFGLGISAVAAFRFTVEKLQQGDDPVADRANSTFQNTMFPNQSQSKVPKKTTLSATTLPTAQKHPFNERILLIHNAKLFAPNRDASIEITVPLEEERQFRFWYDFSSHSIQAEQVDAPENVITVSSDLLRDAAEEELTIIEYISRNLDGLREDFNRERREFHPQTFKIIKSFFEGEKGSAYNRQKPIITDDGIRLWPEKHAGVFELHVHVDSNGQTIKISLDNMGEIEAVELNHQQVSPFFLFDTTNSWNHLLDVFFQDFLKTNALKVINQPINYIINDIHLSYSGILSYNQAIISELPEFVLSKLKTSQLYKYLNDDLTESPGIDLGGLKRQLFSELSLHLFDGSPKRGIHVRNGIPVLHNPDSSIEKELLEMAGKNLIRKALIDESITLGNILDPSVYECFNLLLKFNNKITDDVLMQASQLLCKTEENLFLFDVYNRQRLFSNEEWNFLCQILMIDDVRPTTNQAARELARNLILDDYRSQVMAIHHMVKGALGNTEQEKFIILNLYEEHFDLLTHKQFVEKIQGVKFDPQGIADRIITNSSDKVVRQKTAWLKEYILESDEEEIKRVLMAITGSTTVTAATRIEIKGTNAHNCAASTCTHSLSVPFTHTTVGTDARKTASQKEHFLNNFRLIYSQTGFDMG